VAKRTGEVPRLKRDLAQKAGDLAKEVSYGKCRAFTFFPAFFPTLFLPI